MNRPIEVTVTIEGIEYSGTYLINHGRITVYYLGNEKKTQLAGHASHPEILARDLLSELVEGGSPQRSGKGETAS